MSDPDPDRGPDADRGSDATLGAVARGGTIVFVGGLAGRLLQVLTRALIARALGAVGYGQMVLGLTVLAFLGRFGALGFEVSLARFIPRFVARNSPRALKGLFAAAGTICGLAGLALGATLFLTAPWVAVSLFRDPGLTPLLRIFAVALPFSVLNFALAGALRGFKRMKYLVYTQQFAANGSQLILSGVAVTLGFNVVGVSLLYACSFFVSAAVSLWLLYRTTPVLAEWRSIRGKRMARPLLRFSWPLIPAQQLGQLRSRGDTLLLGLMASSGDVGLYNTASPLARLLQVPLFSLNRMFMPAASELHSRGDMTALRAAYQAVARWTSLITYPALAALILFGGDILELIFGAEYRGAELALMILSAGVFINSATGSFGELLVAVGRPAVNLAVAVTSSTVNVVLNVLLIPPLGIVGAALAAALSLVAACIVGAGYLYHHFRLQPFGLTHLGGAMVVAAAAIVVQLAGGLLPDLPGPIGLLASIGGLYALSLAGYLWTGCLRRSEWRQVRDTVRRRWIRDRPDAAQ